MKFRRWMCSEEWIFLGKIDLWWKWPSVFCTQRFQSRLEMGALNGLDACPLWTCFQVTKTKILAKCVENPKKNWHNYFDYDFSFRHYSTPLRIFEIKDFFIFTCSFYESPILGLAITYCPFHPFFCYKFSFQF